MRLNGYVYALIGLIGMMVTTENSFATGGYRCEGYCAAVDYRTLSLYDAGYIWTEDPSNAPLTFQRLREKCRRKILRIFGVDLEPTLAKTIEGSRDQTDSYSNSHSNVDSRTVYYSGYYWYSIKKSNNNSSSSSTYHHLKTSIKVEQILSRDSCGFDPYITVPTYDGDLPAQG